MGEKKAEEAEFNFWVAEMKWINAWRPDPKSLKVALSKAYAVVVFSSFPRYIILNSEAELNNHLELTETYPRLST
jgi:hypothetical protein